MTKEQRDPGLVAMDKEIDEAKWQVGTWISVCFIIYLVWFLLWKAQFVESPANAGVLGDYFGGLVNPVVALAAFYWVTKGVRIQKQELAETRSALQEQAEHARASVRIDALSSMIDAHTSDISDRREHLAFLVSQRIHGNAHAFYSMRGRMMNSSEFEELVRKLNSGIRVRAEERAKFATELHVLLKLTRSADEATQLRAWEVDMSGEED